MLSIFAKIDAYITLDTTSFFQNSCTESAVKVPKNFEFKCLDIIPKIKFISDVANCAKRNDKSCCRCNWFNKYNKK